jgi:hypothetical protein
MQVELTQEERVIEKLKMDGEVDNFWAIGNYILRLGAIIFELRKKGWRIKGRFGKDRGFEKKFWKNYYYIVIKDGQDKLF